MSNGLTASAIFVVLTLLPGRADTPYAPQGTLRDLRFSPDGRHVLAQNGSEITILTVEPFAVLFRIPAERTEVARFTPDSQQVVFVSGGTRLDPRQISISKTTASVERWSIVDQKLVESHPLPRLICGSEELSPDGTVLVCDTPEGTLQLIEVSSAKTIFEQKKFARLDEIRGPQPGRPAVLFGDLGRAYIEFSPDGHFLVVRTDSGSALIWDLRENKVPAVGGVLKRLRHNSDMLFAFLTSDRVLLILESAFFNEKHGVWTCKLVAFPAGTILSKVKVPKGRFYQTTDPGFILLRPFGKYAFSRPQLTRSALAEISTGKVILSDGALDVFARYYVAEHVIGKEVGLYEIGKGLLSTVVIHPK